MKKRLNKKVEVDSKWLKQGMVWFVMFSFGVLFVNSLDMGVMNKRMKLISLKNTIQQEMRHQHKYKCCLEKPCIYCIEKTPGHGEDEECSCLDDVMAGVHPCGECIGEILEGHGNPLIAKYFARAIAEKTGQIDAIRAIILEKYGTPIEEQLL